MPAWKQSQCDYSKLIKKDILIVRFVVQNKFSVNAIIFCLGTFARCVHVAFMKYKLWVTQKALHHRLVYDFHIIYYLYISYFKIRQLVRQCRAWVAGIVVSSIYDYARNLNLGTTSCGQVTNIGGDGGSSGGNLKTIGAKVESSNLLWKY